ncbi:molybdopterin synthase catalytic subunit MoaE [Agarivorans sp. Toyoura001]|uniref:molybdopterin synthase catalytic subunit MoaE n=1 Tax=unclassified Agarivorans TaxID=2636026 RepID=UPI0010E388AF|nr:molybdopterin synthase catalytic subunit MoaE [Agarivorans sp. Toyoura001]GDY25722.1 molybdopterin guanine dinucleotide biosynthesis protein MoaE [Agarivorans sp. Toyoura001]
MIRVQTDDFNVGDEYQALRNRASAGAIVFFVGLVRDMNLGEQVKGLHLEHYPGMTESQLEAIVEQAKQRWPIQDASVVHRVGDLDVSDQIVFVGVNSAHREASFEACHFIMDYLKTQATFWKKERTNNNDTWLDARESDLEAKSKW